MCGFHIKVWRPISFLGNTESRRVCVCVRISQKKKNSRRRPSSAAFDSRPWRQWIWIIAVTMRGDALPALENSASPPENGAAVGTSGTIQEMPALQRSCLRMQIPTLVRSHLVHGRVVQHRSQIMLPKKLRMLTRAPVWATSDIYLRVWKRSRKAGQSVAYTKTWHLALTSLVYCDK